MQKITEKFLPGNRSESNFKVFIHGENSKITSFEMTNLLIQRQIICMSHV